MRNFLTLILLASIPSCRASSHSKEILKQECMVLFENIMQIQNLRNSLSTGMHMTTVLRNSNEIEREEYIASYGLWAKTEGALRSEVTSIYDVAYEKGCFDEELR